MYEYKNIILEFIHMHNPLILSPPPLPSCVRQQIFSYSLGKGRNPPFAFCFCNVCWWTCQTNPTKTAALCFPDSDAIYSSCWSSCTGTACRPGTWLCISAQQFSQELEATESRSYSNSSIRENLCDTAVLVAQAAAEADKWPCYQLLMWKSRITFISVNPQFYVMEAMAVST